MKPPELFPEAPALPEDVLRRKGYRWIAGVDEAGRGPLAGPVVAAAVILPETYSLEALTDSKKLSPRAREALFDRILDQAVATGIGLASPEEIDHMNILQASLLAMRRALEQLERQPEYVLVDGPHPIPNLALPQQALIRGDLRSPSISAASILAKVTRDRIMDELHEHFPHYGWNRNRGYPTREHYAALERHGPTPYHRRSFRLGPAKP